MEGKERDLHGGEFRTDAETRDGIGAVHGDPAYGNFMGGCCGDRRNHENDQRRRDHF